MKVKELIEKLQNLPQDHEVYLRKSIMKNEDLDSNLDVKVNRVFVGNALIKYLDSQDGLDMAEYVRAVLVE